MSIWLYVVVDSRSWIRQRNDADGRARDKTGTMRGSNGTVVTGGTMRECNLHPHPLTAPPPSRAGQGPAFGLQVIDVVPTLPCRSRTSAAGSGGDRVMDSVVNGTSDGASIIPGRCQGAENQPRYRQRDLQHSRYYYPQTICEVTHIAQIRSISSIRYPSSLSCPLESKAQQHVLCMPSAMPMPDLVPVNLKHWE